MARDWQSATEPQAGDWNIPASTLQNLNSLVQAADSALSTAKNETARTPAASGSPADPVNKGCRIWYSVIGQGEEPPADPEQLRTLFYTMRKKDVIEFAFSDSGKTCSMAAQIENGGKKGP
jgi:hypothetical protein